MAEKRFKLRDFLNDVRLGLDRTSLMSKYGLSGKDLDRLFRRLHEKNLSPLIRLLEEEKLSESQIRRAFGEIEDEFQKKDR